MGLCRLLSVHMAPAPETSTAIMQSKRFSLNSSTVVRSLSRAAADAGAEEVGVHDVIGVWLLFDTIWQRLGTFIACLHSMHARQVLPLPSTHLQPA